MMYNGDGKVDLLDITEAQLTTAQIPGSANWSIASSATLTATTELT